MLLGEGFKPSWRWLNSMLVIVGLGGCSTTPSTSHLFSCFFPTVFKFGSYYCSLSSSYPTKRVVV